VSAEALAKAEFFTELHEVFSGARFEVYLSNVACNVPTLISGSVKSSDFDEYKNKAKYENFA
jgi:hypothetical protein